MRPIKQKCKSCGRDFIGPDHNPEKHYCDRCIDRVCNVCGTPCPSSPIEPALCDTHLAEIMDEAAKNQGQEPRVDSLYYSNTEAGSVVLDSARRLRLSPADTLELALECIAQLAKTPVTNPVGFDQLKKYVELKEERIWAERVASTASTEQSETQS